MSLVIFKSFVPEIFLSLSILIQLAYNTVIFLKLDSDFSLLDKELFSQTFFILFCLLLLFSNIKSYGSLSNFLLYNDFGNVIVKVFLTLSCLFTLSSISQSLDIQKINYHEYYTILLFSILSLLLLISTCDFLSIYLVLEMQVLCFYILASLEKDSTFSAEAGLKYFIFGSVTAIVFLFGCSLLYGVFGTLNIHNLVIIIPFPLECIHLANMATVGLLFIFISFFLKIGVVPFHIWVPDVYEGAPLSSSITFSIFPKIVLFHFLIKFINVCSILLFEFQYLFTFLGTISIFLGTFFAFKQKRFKRLVIFSSIAQTGFLITALSIRTVESLISIYFFLFIDTLTAIIVWSSISQLYNSQRWINVVERKFENTPLHLSSLSNFFWTNKTIGLSFLLVFFSIAGIPPLSGFIAKTLILSSLVNFNFLYSSCIILFTSALSSFYYSRLIKIIFFEGKEKNDCKIIQTLFPLIHNNASSCGQVICLFFLLFFFFYPEPIILICEYILLNTYGN